GFNEQMRQAWKRGEKLILFDDEYRSPIAAGNSARAVWELILQDKPGLYHVAGSERLSRWEIGELLAARWPQLNPKLQVGSGKYCLYPPRPPDTSMNCAKAQRLLSFRLPGLTDWLHAHPREQF